MSELRRVKGYESRYMISDSGEVFSLPSYRKMKCSLNKDGYVVLSLYQKNTSQQFRVHRLVAEAFLDNTQGLPEVHHKDEVKTNNSKDNLEWVTRSQNMEYSFSKEYALVSPTGEITYFKNMNQFCRDNNLNIGHVWRIMKGIRKSTKGWTAYVPS